MERKMAGWEDYPPEHPVQSINSFLGITSHYRAYNIRKRWIYGPLRFSFQEGYYISINDDQMMRHIRIFLIFVANTDRNENNYCRIRVSF